MKASKNFLNTAVTNRLFELTKGMDIESAKTKVLEEVIQFSNLEAIVDNVKLSNEEKINLIVVLDSVITIIKGLENRDLEEVVNALNHIKKTIFGLNEEVM